MAQKCYTTTKKSLSLGTTSTRLGRCGRSCLKLACTRTPAWPRNYFLWPMFVRLYLIFVLAVSKSLPFTAVMPIRSSILFTKADIGNLWVIVWMQNVHSIFFLIRINSKIDSLHLCLVRIYLFWTCSYISKWYIFSWIFDLLEQLWNICMLNCPCSIKEILNQNFNSVSYIHPSISNFLQGVFEKKNLGNPEDEYVCIQATRLNIEK